MGNWRKDKKVEPVKSLPSDVRLGLWGSSGAGKTTYLTMLYLAFEKSREWTIQPANDEAMDFIIRNNKEISKGDFPARTQVNENDQLKIYSYRLEKNNQNQNSITLNFIDAPGEFYENYKWNCKIEDSNNPNENIDIIDYLMNCDGIIFLLDPDPDKENRNKDSYSSMLFNLFLEFNKRHRKNNPEYNQRLEHYIAFCVTKVDRDQIWEKTLNKGADEYVEELISPMMDIESLSNYIYIELDKDKRKERTKYNRCQFFYTSCLGRYQENGQSHSIYIPDKTSSAKPEPTQEPKINRTRDRTDDDDYIYGGDNHGNYSNTGKSESSGNHSDDPYSEINNPSNNLQLQKAKTPGGKIKSGVKLQPFNVLEPVIWLIEGISLHRPNRQPRY